MTINDNLSNQVHFMHFTASAGNGAIVLDGEGRTEMTKGLRATSQAFLGDKSAKSLKDISMKSAKMDRGGHSSGVELLFYGEVTDTREVVFKEVQMAKSITDKSTSNSYEIGEARDWYNQNIGNMDYLWGIGHTHTPGWFRVLPNGPVPKNQQNSNQMLRELGKPSGSVGNTDYRLGGVRETMPRFIGSPLGISVYSAIRPYDPDKNVYRYGFFKK